MRVRMLVCMRMRVRVRVHVYVSVCSHPGVRTSTVRATVGHNSRPGEESTGRQGAQPLQETIAVVCWIASRAHTEGWSVSRLGPASDTGRVNPGRVSVVIPLREHKIYI